MADIIALKKRRAYIKGNMTKVLNFINAINKNTNAEDIKVRLTNVERYRNEFIEVENKIVTMDNNEDLDQDFEENYYKAIAGLNLALRKMMEPTFSLNDTVLDASMAGNHIDVKLPKISIPIFAGDYTEWQSFHDLYCSTIHDNARLTPSQKLQYLKGSLKGEAAGLLKHFSITDANYIEALGKLRERYDRRKHTIYAFVKSFMFQPPVTTPNSTNVRILLDTSDEIIRGLKALGEEAETRDHWLIHILVSKLDYETNSLWAQTSAEYELPTLKQFFDFLARRIDALESLKYQNKRVPPQLTQSKPHIKSHVVASENKDQICSVCSEEHKLFECGKFKNMSVVERKSLLIQENRCFNCLNNNHSVYNCKSRFRCKLCNRKHHSLLHESFSTTTQANAAQSDTQLTEIEASGLTTSTYIGSAILPTALVRVTDAQNQNHLYRALLDSGSQVSFISENCAQRLQLPRNSAKIAITGIGATSSGYTKGSVSLKITPWNKDNPSLQIDAFVLPKLTARQPPVSRHIDIQFLKKYELADPHFHKGKEIDIIIGADNFFELLVEGKITTSNQFIMQKTLLGWIVAGRTNEPQAMQVITATLNDPEDSLDNLLRKFWEIEEIEAASTKLSEEEQLCESQFQNTTTTDHTGRFKVRLPFKRFPSILGDSYRTAAKRMHSMEKRFNREKEFALMYKTFISEYISLGHMKAVNETELKSNGYYLPHHGVIKDSSTTTKLRVVFDGSAKTTTGSSLNDCLAVGPTIQSTLYDILIRFRMYKVAFTADVEKMFRQVLVAEDDTKYQRILWRDSPDKPFITYELQTVVYGTASASYLATRALNEAAAKCQESFPEAAHHIMNNFYVDDLMTGADSLEKAITLKHDINAVLLRSGFPLRKWLTNEESLLRDTFQPTEEIANLEIEKCTSVKVLGLYWNPMKDCFQFKVNLNQQPTMTKRGILSESSRLFDPLGWLAPVTISIKIFFQTLWAKNLKWDDQLPKDVQKEWQNLRENLPKIELIEVERYIYTNADTKLSLHGFSDASRHAYSAVVYGHIIKPNGDSIIRLLSAKTKVAPVKQISIPRLELCGALLLNRLLITIKQALKTEITEITAWTDSTIVLDWLSAPPTKWNTFVGNRTGEILTTMSRSQWRHVDSKDNPADCASRGIEPEKLLSFSLWWNGPKWIANCATWPKNRENHADTTEEMRSHSTHAQIRQPTIIDDLIKRISSFSKITRILAYILRFIDIKLNRIPNNIVSPYLLSRELQKPQRLIFSQIQSKYFELEINLIAANKEIPSSSKLKHLNPFLDELGLLRVGGRITNAAMTYAIKHPIILPARDELTELIVVEHHLRYLHAGQTLMIATLRQKYWILGCKQLVRKVVHGCVKCLKYKGQNMNQMMGNLPNPRVELVRPFFKVGVDYAGPFQTHLVRGRGQKLYKSYICIFVCLATKAVHIELVSELTTESYIAALRRFIARRGICKEIHSDNGTNFIGARNHLHELYNFLRQNNNTISKFLLTDEITFKFIPPSAPHFGGLWEAAVKRVKYHLRRVTDGHIITTEEMTTLLAEIEAILNSRPICVLSSEDLEYLTPAHFLIGRPTTQLPSDDLQDVKISKLSRWQMVEKMNQDIWKRWHLEYLTNLQHRSKWHKKENNCKIGDIVLVKENNLPPSKWLMGRITEVHPGSDNIIRVVTLKTTNGIIKRPIHKLCLLPVS